MWSLLFGLKKKQFNIIQWNCRGLSSKLQEFSNLILKFDVDCIQETWLNDSHIIRFKNYACFRSDRNPPLLGRGTLIVCRNYLDPICYPNQSGNFRM